MANRQDGTQSGVEQKNATGKSAFQAARTDWKGGITDSNDIIEWNKYCDAWAKENSEVLKPLIEAL